MAIKEAWAKESQDAVGKLQVLETGVTITTAVKTTDEEKKVVKLLGEAFTLFARLPGVSDQDKRDMCGKVHACQDMVAYRVASRVDPDFWTVPGAKPKEGA